MSNNPKRARDIPLYVRVTQGEYDAIQNRMAEVCTTNMAAYIRKMALNGFVIHVDLSPVRELVSLQRKCANNMNQIAINVNTFGGATPQEITALQRDYTALWEPLSSLLRQLADLVKM